MVEGGPLDGDGKAVVGCRCGRVVLYRDTVFLPALLPGRVQGPGDCLRRAAVVCHPGSRAVPHGDGCFYHGQHGIVRLRRFRGRDRHIGTAVIVVIASPASAGIGFNSHDAACFLAAVLGDDGDGGRPLFDGGYVAACVHGRYVGIAGLPAYRLVGGVSRSHRGGQLKGTRVFVGVQGIGRIIQLHICYRDCGRGSVFHSNGAGGRFSPLPGGGGDGGRAIGNSGHFAVLIYRNNVGVAALPDNFFECSATRYKCGG